MAPAIPDRWLDYKPIGERIEGTRFIAFKVPLRDHVNESVDKPQRLDGNLLLEHLPNLGIIIDLTNTFRYYNPDFFQSKGVEHKKLMIPGHHTPPNELVQEFKLYVRDFLKNNKTNDKLIGVHCTHGVNRTGYLICNYMISEMTIEPREAIKRFDAARGHKIERENYLVALQELKVQRKSTLPLVRRSSKTHTTDDTPKDYKSWRLSRKAHSASQTKSYDQRDRFARCRDEARRQTHERKEIVRDATQKRDCERNQMRQDNGLHCSYSRHHASHGNSRSSTSTRVLPVQSSHAHESRRNWRDRSYDDSRQRHINATNEKHNNRYAHSRVDSSTTNTYNRDKYHYERKQST